MIRKYLFYVDINEGYIFVVKNEGVNVEVFYLYFCRNGGTKNQIRVFLKNIAGVIIFNPTVGSLWFLDMLYIYKLSICPQTLNR